MGDNKTYIGSALMAFFSGLTIVDWTAIIGLVISGGFTAWQFYCGRQDAKENRRLLRELLLKKQDGLGDEKTDAAIINIMSKTQ